VALGTLEAELADVDVVLFMAAAAGRRHFGQIRTSVTGAAFNAAMPTIKREAGIRVVIEHCDWPGIARMAGAAIVAQ